MRRILLSGIISATLVVHGVAAQEPSQQDREFLDEAIRSGLFEIAVGRLAAEHSGRPDLAEFSAMLAEDYDVATEQLRRIAGELDLEAPEELSEEEQYHSDQLTNLSGRELDLQYIDVVVNEHHEMVDMFQTQIAEGEVPQLVSFAESNLPEAQQKLQRAEEIEAAVKGAEN